MKLGKAVLYAPILLAALLRAPQAKAGDDINEQLKSEYLGKVLTLRNFYKGEHLAFQSDGSLIGVAEIGPWTVDGQIVVLSIDLKGPSLRIHARRVCLAFDSKAKAFRDVLDLLAESKAPDRNALQGAFWANEVDIEVLLPSQEPSLQEIASTMDAIFLAEGDPIREIVPDFWRDYFDEIEGQPQSVRHTTEPVYSVTPGGVSAPRATHQVDPEFSEEARRAKYKGRMTLCFVVDPSGSVRDIEIVSPLGMGLDEKAVAAVGAWKFQPGMKAGTPVAVKIQVAVEFDLY